MVERVDSLVEATNFSPERGYPANIPSTFTSVMSLRLLFPCVRGPVCLIFINNQSANCMFLNTKERAPSSIGGGTPYVLIGGRDIYIYSVENNASTQTNQKKTETCHLMSLLLAPTRAVSETCVAMPFPSSPTASRILDFFGSVGHIPAQNRTSRKEVREGRDEGRGGHVDKQRKRIIVCLQK